jgi:hypothetical protein
LQEIGIFTVIQTKCNEFLLGIIGKYQDTPIIAVYNTKTNKVDVELKSLTGSINLNQLHKIPGFSIENPYVVYRDSRGVCLINVLDNYEQTLL